MKSKAKGKAGEEEGVGGGEEEWALGSSKW